MSNAENRPPPDEQRTPATMRRGTSGEENSPAIANRLAEVARQHLRIETLEERRSDNLDFHTVGVWAVRPALRAAYEIGLEHGRRPMEAVLLDALEQIRDQLQDLLGAEDMGTPYTHGEVMTWLGEMWETAVAVIAEAKGDGR